MPAATTGDRTVQASSPEVGSGLGPVFAMTRPPCGAQTEALKQVLNVIDKKVRNMEKKKSKLDDYKAKKEKGENLNQDQLEALSKCQEVANNLEFARELQKSLLTLGQDIQKAVKKAARRDQVLRECAEQKRLKSVLELQFVLDQLGEEAVRRDLEQGPASSPLLTEQDLARIDSFCKLVSPERDPNTRLIDQYEEASVHLWALLEGREKEVAGTTYKVLKDTLDRVLQSGYFDKAEPHHNGACEEEEEEEKQQDEEDLSTAVEPKAETGAEDPSTEPEGEFTDECAEPVEVEGAEFVNRRFVSEAAYASSEQEQREEWRAESEVGSAVQQQVPVQTALPSAVPEPHVPGPVVPAPTPDPMVRKQAVQDLMAQMQGPYNFMQDSMLEFDGQALDPAILSAQPMKAMQNLELPHTVCPPVRVESRLTQPSAVPVQQEPTQVSLVPSTSEAYSKVQPLYQPPHTTDPRPQSETVSPIQVFQPVSKPLHSSGINVNAAPFQSIQTVFNMNAPVPPGNSADTMKASSQFQSSYGQGFSGQTQHAVEQSELQQQESLPSIIGAFHAHDQTVPGTGGEPPVAQVALQQGSGFGCPGQSFYGSRAMSRGGPRTSRAAPNGYRGPSGAFRGGYDGYRPAFPNTPSSGYGQGQFSTPRAYSNSSYQREGYQQNFKRGAGQGGRGTTRGTPQVMRS